MLCALDVIYTVTDAVGVFVGQVIWKYLLEKYAFSVVAFNCHSDICSLLNFSVKGAFFEQSDVDLYVHNCAAKAFIGEVRKQPHRVESYE